MKQDNNITELHAREANLRMATVVPSVLASPRTNGNSDSIEIPDSGKAYKVVRLIIHLSLPVFS